MKFESETLLADEDTWKAILEPSLCEDSATVEVLARLLLTLKKAIDSGPEGAIRASHTLLRGIELIYPYTDAHKAALKLYVLSLEGNLKPDDEPLNLINAAVERHIASHTNN
ncbi:MAG TPA: hypothetical protein VM914_03545 [Pyrinomonadaceae bacterium]|jgi:hypothetical protein|nr:hypothetical protein [Pyrinomonadaceae bacterium]